MLCEVPRKLYAVQSRNDACEQGRREPVRAPGYFIAPGPSEQSISSLNATFAGPGPPTLPTAPLDGLVCEVETATFEFIKFFQL